MWRFFHIFAILFMLHIVCAKFGDKDGTTTHFLYFAYGSNLLDERIRVQITDAKFVSIGVLSDYALAFADYGKSNRWHSGAATIVERKGTSVWGCIWLVPNSFAAELDKQETDYERIEVNVQPKRSEIERFNSQLGTLQPVLKCRTYQYKPDIYARPSPQYKHVIVAGAEEHGLPRQYIDWVRNTFPDNGYAGPVDVQLKALETMPKPMMTMNHQQQQQQQKRLPLAPSTSATTTTTTEAQLKEMDEEVVEGSQSAARKTEGGNAEQKNKE